MATNYFRVTAYHPIEDISVIFDSNGFYEKLWELSSFLIQKGFKIIEVSNDEKFLDVNINKAEPDTKNLILRANHKGKPEYTTQIIDHTCYVAVKVGSKIYVPDKEKLGVAL